MDAAQTLFPEEVELNKKRRLLDRLNHRLADREEEALDLGGEIERFETRYTMEVGKLYSQQDEIDAQIAEEELKLVPDDEDIKKRVEELRRLAEESAARTRAAEEKSEERYEPTVEAKKAYHNIARAIHPDLALDAAEKERRHGLMAELNRAYSSGDQQMLDRLVEEYRVSPEMVVGTSIGDDLVRCIRQISQVRTRLENIKVEMAAHRESDLFELFEKYRAEGAEGRDLLKQMAERAKTHIKKTERRLENLRNVTAAQEDYVKETFGMDIDEFRKG